MQGFIGAIIRSLHRDHFESLHARLLVNTYIQDIYVYCLDALETNFFILTRSHKGVN